MNTDGAELNQFIQGMYDQSTRLELNKDKSAATLPGVPANAAEPHSEGICQWCGTFRHGASQCGALLKLIESSDHKKPHHCLDDKKKSLNCSHCDKTRHTADHCWELHPELMLDWYQPSRSEAEKKTKPEVKAAAVMLADGGGSMNTFSKAVVTAGDGRGPMNTVTMGMDEMIEFAQEFAQQSSAEGSTPFKICGC